MSGRLVYAKESGTLADASGLPFRLVANEPWDADDPLVKRHPQAFSAEPLRVASSRLTTTAEPRVEQATRSPGELRKRVG